MSAPPLSANDGAPRTPGRAWLFSPGIDLLFIANLAWPLVLLVMLFGGLDARENCEFWQIYFVTTPHRWVTLVLVYGDGDRFLQRRGIFLGIAVVVVVLAVGVRISTGALTCLLAIDYLWNAWHFAAQHHGIFRIYGRMAQPERTSGMAVEKALMRAYMLYVVFRVATWTWLPSTAPSWFAGVDWAALGMPAWLIAREIAAFDRRALGRMAYLISFSTLYSALLLSVRWNRPALVLTLTTASALFHAVEYLAIVSWSVEKGHGANRAAGTFLGWLLSRWGLALMIFMVILGGAGWLMSHHLMQTWLLINVIVAYLHYAYDGIIWKSKRPTAAAT